MHKFFGAKSKPLDLLLLLVAAVLALAFTTPTILQTGWLDPFVYAGYINDYANTYARYGHTYYGSRVAYIFPDMFFQRVFGTELGYHLIRIVMLFAAGLATYSIALRYYSREVALFACSWLLFTPWLMRSLTWTHYDGFATIYILISIAFFLSDSPWRRTAFMLSGAFYYFAVNCNLIIFAIGGLFFGADFFLTLLKQQGIKKKLIESTYVVMGFIAGFIFLSLLFYTQVKNPELFLEKTSIAMAKSLVGGVNKNWFNNFEALLNSGYIFFLVPFLYALISLPLFISKSKIHKSDTQTGYFEYLSASYIALLLCFALYMHYATYHGWFGYFYYTIYFVPASLLVMIALSGKLTSGDPVGAKWLTLWAVIIFPLISKSGIDWNGYIKLTTSSYALPISLLFVSFFVGMLLGFWKFRRVGYLAILGFSILTVLILDMSMPVGSSKLNTHRANIPRLWVSESGKEDQIKEWNLYKGAIYFQQVVNSIIANEKLLTFWYRNGNGHLDSVQSMFLWGYSRLASTESGQPGMPYFEPRFREILKPGLALVMLGDSENEIEVAKKSLTENKVHFKELHKDSYHSQNINLYFSIVEIVEDLGAVYTDVPISAIVAASGTQVVIGKEGRAAFVTPQCIWCYAAQVDLLKAGMLTDTSIKQFVVIRARVLGGRVGVALYDRDNPSSLKGEIEIASGDFRDLVFPIESAGAIGGLVFRSVGSGTGANIEIESIKLSVKTPQISD